MKQHDDALPDALPSMKQTVQLTRRGFLKAAPLGALAAVAATPASATPASAPAPQPTAARGYHETEHIRRYYQTAAYW